MTPREVPAADLTDAQLWQADISFRNGAYIDELTGREMDPGELVRVPAAAEDPEPEIEAEAGL